MLPKLRAEKASFSYTFYCTVIVDCSDVDFILLPSIFR